MTWHACRVYQCPNKALCSYMSHICMVHLVQVVLNWYNLVAASAAGGVPLCD
jgi:hypothetical protein